MIRSTSRLVGVAAVLAVLPWTAHATTREIAELEPARLTFGRSVLNELTYDTYRDPFDELQERPYNLLFTNIGRHANLSPWEGQQGRYTRYVNALIGNNGAANVDNDADAIQGSVIWRQTPSWSWGISAALLAGTNGSDDLSGTSAFSGQDDLTGFDVRFASAFQLSERRVLGAGMRFQNATRDAVDSSFEAGVGGFVGTDKFQQNGVSIDVGLRQFQTVRSSWEVRGAVGYGDATQDTLSESLDDAGVITDRFVVTKYDIQDLSFAVHGGYNRLRAEGIGETQYRAGYVHSERELGNDDLSYAESGGVITPNTTLLAQDPISTDRIGGSARHVFAAGETEMFVGGDLGYVMVSGSTRVDAAGAIVNESIDDTFLQAGLTIGIRQPLFRDKLRFVVGGRADLVDRDTVTRFDSGSDGESATLTTAQYSVGVEGVLANVTLDLAWLFGEEAPVVSPSLGLPEGSRRTVAVDRLVFSAAVSW